VGAAQRALLELDSARAAHLQALEANRALGAPIHMTLLIIAELCADAVLAGDWAAAGDYALQLAAADPTEAPRVEPLLWRLTIALVRSGNGDRAETWLPGFAARIGDNRRLHIPYLCAQATLAQWRGDLSAAAARLETARGLAQAIGLPGEQRRIDAALAELRQVSS
jgi:hypothetical protein